MEVCEGIHSLELKGPRFDLEPVLCLPSLCNLTHLGVIYPERIILGPTLPFRLSSIKLRLDPHTPNDGILQLLSDSKDTLTTLELISFNDPGDTETAIVALFSALPFPNLRHLLLTASASSPSLERLLRNLPRLQSAVIRLSPCGTAFSTLFGTISRACPPTLLSLRFTCLGGALKTSFITGILRQSLSSPQFPNLRQLHLPPKFCGAGLDDGGWAEFQPECLERGLRVFLK